MGRIDPSASKKDLRQYYKQELQRNKALVNIEPLELAQRITQWVREQPDCTRVATFAHLPDQEPDLALLHELLPRHSFVYPRVENSTKVSFHLVSDPGALVTGSYGIREPDPRIHPQALLEDIDLYLCPGLAFGKDGSRLGRGGGFYDRALENARSNALRLGVCFPFQRCDSLPCEEHDSLMTHFDDGNSITAV